MLKVLSHITLFLFVFVASLAPYSSAKGASQAFLEESDERELTNQIDDEEVFYPSIVIFFMETPVKVQYFPSYICLRAQLNIIDILKPPLA